MRHVHGVDVVFLQLGSQRSMSCVVSIDQNSSRKSEVEAGDGGATAINDVGFVDRIAKVGCQHQEQNTKTPNILPSIRSGPPHSCERLFCCCVVPRIIEAAPKRDATRTDDP